MGEYGDLKGGLYVRRSLSTTESTLLASLAEKGRDIFNLDDVMETLGVTYENAKVIVNRLEKKAWLIRLSRGTYLLVPLEAGVRSLYTEHGFVVASHLVDPYYIGYGSALNYHGLSEYVPSSVFVVTSKRRSDRVIMNTRFRFITVTESRLFGVEAITVSGKQVSISGVEKTVADCLDHPEYCRGVDEIAKSIFFGHNELDVGEIILDAQRMGNKTIVKRLGYLLELFGYHEYDYLFDEIVLSKGYPKLDPGLPDNGVYEGKWGLKINTEINPEVWMG